jgi:DNA-binding transcriptional LysR family regulator
VLNHIDLSRIDLNLLVVFSLVLEVRHVGRAADRLNLTPSAVSHALGRLRGLLNDPLFLRTPRGVVPTARALELGEPVADILNRVERVMASAVPFEATKSERRFVIGAPDAVMTSVVTPILRCVRTNAPDAGAGPRLKGPAVARELGEARKAADRHCAASTPRSAPTLRGAQAF